MFRHKDMKINRVEDKQHIERCFKQTNSFKVPEGYFERVVDDILVSLPRQEQQVVPARHARFYPLHTRWLVAGCVLAALLSVTLYFHHTTVPSSSNQSEPTSTYTGNYTSETLEEAAFISLMDDEDLYSLFEDD